MNMTIRLATEHDTHDILELFKLSLGEEGGIPEAAFWQWKHIQNPFGASPTLLAFEDDTLIGLRTFLCWRFRLGQQPIQAYRAVDTATHPEYRNKGIFRTLTLALINQLKDGEPSIIFNTPNHLSKPGYLKMGWKEFGKTPLFIQPLPQYWLVNRIRKYSASGKYCESREWEDDWLSIEADFRKLTEKLIVTDYTLAYLRWRYCNIPGFTYQYESQTVGADKALLFYRVKQLGKLRELRITDVFFNHQTSRAVRKAFQVITSLHKPDVVSVLVDRQHVLRPLLPFGFISLKRAGLDITYREVNDKVLTTLASQSDKWFLTSGTIELL